MPQPRKRLKRYEVTGQPRFLTFSCLRRMQLFGAPAIRDAFAQDLETCRESRGFLLHAWVVMPEHVHLLITPADTDRVETILYSLKRRFGRRAIARWRELHAPILQRLTGSDGRTRFWQPGGGYDRNMKCVQTARKAVEYIHANPVRRELVKQPCDWKWSSAMWYECRINGRVRVDPIDW